MKDDKKKVVVLAVLGVAIIAVGAFQFTAGSAPAPQPAAAKSDKTEKTEDPATGTESNEGTEVAANATNEAYAGDRQIESSPALAQLYSMKLPPRDPFAPATLPAAPQEAKPPVAQQAPPPRVANNWRPTPQMPPFDPMGGGLPNVGGNISMQPNGQGAPVNLPPAAPSYTVSGVMRGQRNAAVITDAQGNQRLVKEGQELDGDTKVVSIQGNKVTLRRNGKTITLSVGGNSQ